MSLSTTLLVIEYDHGAQPLIPETPSDWTLDEAMSAILSGEPFGTLRAVYRISDGRCEDVSEQVADRIIEALRRGDFVSPFAREFANYCSRDMPREAA
jgi:hypothetical protein